MCFWQGGARSGERKLCSGASVIERSGGLTSYNCPQGHKIASPTLRTSNSNRGQKLLN